MEFFCDLCSIAINKNTVYGDRNALYPSGIRIGTAAMTTKGLKETYFAIIADILDECVAIIQKYYKSGMKFIDFKQKIHTSAKDDITRIKNRVAGLL